MEDALLARQEQKAAEAEEAAYAEAEAAERAAAKRQAPVAPLAGVLRNKYNPVRRSSLQVKDPTAKPPIPGGRLHGAGTERRTSVSLEPGLTSSSFKVKANGSLKQPSPAPLPPNMSTQRRSSVSLKQPEHMEPRRRSSVSVGGAERPAPLARHATVDNAGERMPDGTVARRRSSVSLAKPNASLGSKPVDGLIFKHAPGLQSVDEKGVSPGYHTGAPQRGGRSVRSARSGSISFRATDKSPSSPLSSEGSPSSRGSRSAATSLEKFVALDQKARQQPRGRMSTSSSRAAGGVEEEALAEDDGTPAPKVKLISPRAALRKQGELRCRPHPARQPAPISSAHTSSTPLLRAQYSEQ
jgi:hypothetical protein